MNKQELNSIIDKALYYTQNGGKGHGEVILEMFWPLVEAAEQAKAICNDVIHSKTDTGPEDVWNLLEKTLKDLKEPSHE